MFFKCDCFDYVSGESLGSFEDFFLAAGISAEIQNMHDVSCPLSFNPGIGNEPAGSLFSKPT
jgi:hypothetical protein